MSSRKTGEPPRGSGEGGWRGGGVEGREEETRMDRWTVQSRESGYRADVITAAARDQSWFADLFLPPVCVSSTEEASATRRRVVV